MNPTSTLDNATVRSYLTELQSRITSAIAALDGKAFLTHTTPAVIEDIAFEEQPLRVLELEQILDDEGFA